MSDVIRVENNVPTVYCNDSRDFQLLCRLYTAVVNSVKFDIDTMQYLTSTAQCKSKVLELLATKLGFLTNNEYEDDKLRYILQAFPDMVKNKGSLKAIKQCVNTFLKIYNVRTNILIWYTSEATSVYNVAIDDHTIIVGLNEALRGGTRLLQDMLRFILPTGFGLYIYYYRSLSDNTVLIDSNKATLLFVSDDINSQVRTAIQNEYVMNGNVRDSWAEKAIVCDDANLQVKLNWDLFYKKVGHYKYGTYTFRYVDGQWRINGSLFAVDPEEYGIGIVGNVKADTRITVYSVSDELVGAVDTTELIKQVDVPDFLEPHSLSEEDNQ